MASIPGYDKDWSRGYSAESVQMTGTQRYVYYVIMYSAHVELAVSPVNAGHLVGAVSRCYT